MSKEKFPQGEWRVEDFNEWDIAGVFIVDKEDNPIAKMCERFVMTPMPGRNLSQLVESKEEQEAAAALIAAAPDMYRVLSGICWEKSAQICKYAPESCKVCSIRKALKKARGEE